MKLKKIKIKGEEENEVTKKKVLGFYSQLSSCRQIKFLVVVL